jgi:hypothetical protein
MRTQQDYADSTLIFGFACAGLIVLFIARALLGPGM